MIVIFDLDGTLINDEIAVKKAATILHYKNRELWNCDLDEFLTRWKQSLNRYFKEYEQGEISFTEQGMKRIIETSRINISKKTAMRIYSQYLEEYVNSAIVFEDTFYCLERLKRHRLGIITNGTTDEQMKKLEKTNIAEYFEEIIISEDIGCNKPSEIIFKHAISKFNSTSTHIYIGDKYKTDALASSQHGFTGVWLNRTNEIMSEIHNSITSVSSLREFVLFIDECERK